MIGVADLLRSRTAWLLVGALALAVTIGVLVRDRDDAIALAEARAEALTESRAVLRRLEDEKATALADKADAEDALAAYAEDAMNAWKEQSAAAARTAAVLEKLDRRTLAATQEIARADGGLRLDDPLPGGLRDALACARGDAAACAAASDPGRVPAGIAGQATVGRADAGGSDRPGGADARRR